MVARVRCAFGPAEARSRVPRVGWTREAPSWVCRDTGSGYSSLKYPLDNNLPPCMTAVRNCVTSATSGREHASSRRAG